MQLTRRSFLIGSALAPGMSAMAPGAAPALRFPTAARDRLAIASYSFRSLIDTPRNRARNTVPQGGWIALKDFPALMAQKYNVHAVELLNQHFPSVEPAYLRELREAVQSAGSRIVNIPTGVGASVYDTDESRRALAVVNAKKWVDTAVALDCPSIRVHIQGAKGLTPDAELAARSLLEIALHGQARGVVVNLENDDPATEDAFFVAKVIDRAHSPWLRALPDFCNSMLRGDEKFNYDAVSAMFQRAYNISHVKDSEVDGDRIVRVDLARTFMIAKESGYKGWFSIEWEGAGDVWEENGKLIGQSLRYMG
ncbi:MAG: sugar phosphate isomerase/epimerase family protein [Acidobacteriota bacterium]